MHWAIGRDWRDAGRGALAASSCPVFPLAPPHEGEVRNCGGAKGAGKRNTGRIVRRVLYACVTHWPAFHIAALRRPPACSCDPNQRGHGMLSDILFILGGLAVFLLAGLAVRGADRL